ncbi:PE-PPE domain-containing protein [Mycobacterium sp. SMC-4]|uniref:PE-PPE domain-containing protein n=1 Tax=Mycobacterium sp. SMC-4 TaxID=2857059 RepID=UPI003D04E128
MRKSIRKAGLACGAAFASAALALSAAAPGSALSSAVVIGGLATPEVHPIVISQLLGGKLADDHDILRDAKWPAAAGPYTGKDDPTLGQSITAGMQSLTAAINEQLALLERDANGNVVNGEKVTVVGLSAGSLVVNEVLRQMAADPNAVGADEIRFVLVADSSRQELIKDARYNPRYDYTYQPAPEVKYDIHVITGEYDGMADFPDRWWNVLAVVNAIAGGIVVHVPVMFKDYEAIPAENITETINESGGVTKHFLVPTERLPLVQLLPFLAPREAELKAKIDKGYKRNDADTGSARRSASTAAPVLEQAADEDDATSDTEESNVDTAVEEDAATEDAATEDAATEDVATEDVANDEAVTDAAEDVVAEDLDGNADLDADLAVSTDSVSEKSSARSSSSKGSSDRSRSDRRSSSDSSE